MSNKNYTNSKEEFRINKDTNEFAVHHTDYNSHGRHSYDYDVSGGGRYNDHIVRNNPKEIVDVSDEKHKVEKAKYK